MQSEKLKTENVEVCSMRESQNWNDGIIDSLHDAFCELGCENFADVLKAYFTARIILSHTTGAQHMETMLHSLNLQKTIYAFKEAVSHAYFEERYTVWARFCYLLTGAGLDQDYPDTGQAELGVSLLHLTVEGAFGQRENTIVFLEVIN